jgi:glycosyltransferase involved in cell wall biosynthesis
VNPLVSIVINNYNYGRYIRQAIESALAQTYGNCEVVIVDDGSTDDSRTIIEEYTDRARVFFKENGGQASAFNAGIRAAIGNYILLLDSDDYLFPEAVETCLECFPEGYSRVYYRLQVVDDNGSAIRGDVAKGVFRDFDGDVYSMLALHRATRFYFAPTSANFFDAKKLKKILPIPEVDYRICADAFIAFRTSLKGPMRSIDRELAAYRVHGNNNFTTKSRLLSDKKVLRNHIDNHYKYVELLEGVCREAGYSYDKERDDESVSLLRMLCAGYALKVDSPHIAGLKRRVLLRRVLQYSWFGDDSLVRRVRQGMLMSLVLVLPVNLAKGLLRLQDLWSYREY